MISSRKLLQEEIQNYSSIDKIEQDFCSMFLELLQHPQCYFRDHLPGHITGSAWIVDETKQLTLLTHHAKLNKWLQPGGHADGDENIFNVALREAEEETGLKNLRLIIHPIFDLDIHTIPARKDFPEHLHFDVRFIFEASRKESLILTEESHDLRWINLTDLETLTTNPSMLRLKAKTLNLA